MRTRIITLGTFVMLGTAALILAQTETAASRFARAQETERTKGLEAAIPTYESILRDFPNDRVNSAKALLQLAKAYDLLGQSEKGRQSLQQILDRYSDQADAARDARSLLAKLPSPRSSPPIGIFVAEMDSRTGIVRDAVRAITENSNFDEAYATFSPDGKSIAFRRFRPGSGAAAALVVRSLETKIERTTDSSPCVTLALSPSRWFADGKSLLAVVRSSPTGDSCILRYNLEKRLTFEVLMRAGSDLIGNYAALSPDGKTLYADQGGPGARSAPVTVVRALDLVARQPRQVYDLPSLQGRTTFTDIPTPPIMAMSPSGRTMAHIRWADSLDAHLVRYDVDGTDLRYRDLLSGVGRMQVVSWTRDGARILFANSTGPQTWRILQIPAEGGQARFTGLEVTGLMHFDLSPDGSQIIFDGLSYTISAPDLGQ